MRASEDEIIGAFLYAPRAAARGKRRRRTDESNLTEI
jgi:hypothetical protein